MNPPKATKFCKFFTIRQKHTIQNRKHTSGEKYTQQKQFCVAPLRKVWNQKLQTGRGCPQFNKNSENMYTQVKIHENIQHKNDHINTYVRTN